VVRCSLFDVTAQYKLYSAIFSRQLSVTCGDVSTVTSHQMCLLAQKRGSIHREEQGQVPLYRCTQPVSILESADRQPCTAGRVQYALPTYTSHLSILPVIQQTVTIIKRRQARYKYVTFGARSRDHFCIGKAINDKYYECVFVAFVIQHAMRMRGVVVWSMSGSTEIFQITSKTARFSSTKLRLSHILLWFY